MKWRLNARVFSYFVFILIAYLVLKLRTFDYTSNVIIKNTNPEEVWEFVADFSNMKTLNPTIINFSIISESGNYDHWKYSIRYTEHLSHWPYTENESLGHFNVKTGKEKDVFYITSTHQTCLFFGMYCVNSEGEFKFKKNALLKGTHVEENIRYQCPTLFMNFCKSEVAYQREAIFANLQKHFLKRH